MTNSTKILLFISTMIFLFFCSAFVLLYREINNNNQKIQQEDMNLQIEAHRRDSVASLNQTLQQIAPERALLENHFVKSSNVVPFLNALEQLALQAGVLIKINSINTNTEAKTKTDNSELTVDLKSSGSFEAIYKFLTLLENFPYELDFISMDLRKNLFGAPGENIKDSNWEAILKIQLLSFIQ